MAKKRSYLTVTDQFCGAGGSSQGVRNYARRAGLNSGLEVRLAMNHWKLALETHNTNFPDATHVATDISACNPKDYPSTDILITSPECFPAGTLVLCDRGLVPIERVVVGDHVLTHMDRWQRVIRVASRKAPTVFVQGQGHPGLECTAEHPFYVRRQSRPWNNALRRNVRHIADPEWMEAGKLADQDVRWATPMNVPGLCIPAVGGRGVQFTEAFWWMVGRWLADGTVRQREGRGEITIACGTSKVAYTAARLEDVMRWRSRAIRTAVLFETGHDGLVQWLVQYFGKLAHGKTLPAWCFGMNLEWRQALLEGYLSGDGNVGSRRTQASTVSKSMAIGLRLLVTSLGYHATIGLYDQHCDTIEGRKVNTRPVYMVTWENNRSQRTGWHDDRHAWSLVKAVKTARASAEVYCLSVEKDESFVADGIVVHNCTNHSVAKGRKQVKAQLDAFDKGEQDAAAERSRATMWDVVRFAEYHKYRIIITENVVDACAWVLIDAWLKAMDVLGYHHERVYFNSMFAWPTPQSRDRVYYVFWQKKQPRPNLDFRPLAPCAKCGPVHAIQRMKPGGSIKKKYGTQYTYVCPSCAKEVMPFYFAAINAIDFSVPAERIGDRKKPLEPRTMQRIAYGLEKYGNRPLSITNYFSSGVACRVKDATDAPLFTQHGKAGTAVATPYLLNMRGTSEKHLPHSTEGMFEALGAQTGVTHHALLSPLLVETKFSHAGEKRAKSGADPLPGQTGQASLGVAMPYIMDSSFTKANGEYMNGGEEPMGTQTTAQSKGVVIPPALMMSLNYPEQSAKPLDVPMDTQTGNRPMALVMSAGSAEVAARPASDPTPTFTGSDRVAMVVDTNYFTEHVRPADGVLPAQTAANKLAFLTGMRGTEEGHVKAAASGLDEPVGTISAGGNHHALISGKAMGFLTSQYSMGHNTRPLDDAMGALSCRDRHSLLTGQAPKPRIEDLYFRMLKPHEVQAGMAFDREYVVLGNSREKVKQLGNAVTPPVMEMIVERCIESLM